MIGQISASNQLRTSSELAPNMFGASSELASVMEFGFYFTLRSLYCAKKNRQKSNPNIGPCSFAFASNSGERFGLRKYSGCYPLSCSTEYSVYEAYTATKVSHDT